MSKLKPNLYVEDATKIDYKQLEEMGIKLLCFDLDNTLDIPDRITTELIPICEKTLELIAETDLEILITSNNSIPNRVKSFADLIDRPYISKMQKPFQKKYKSSKVITKYQPQEIMFIGDKLVTDVIGGNAFGSYTTLVDPLVSNKKHWYTHIMTVSDNFYQFLIGFKRGRYYNRLETK
ncbi:YqeG family HAD IIIA-type phosphatase [Mollicutes bacterium LVI A0078]|nr:YqeG family HAD IIIA-type phosphatase [Mollicutes bacterium LVI A0075]WOO90086.1 YqeG family HAD IIIA-type phosphatase [Mollicutes bacterium LVI A0078]